MKHWRGMSKKEHGTRGKRKGKKIYGTICFVFSVIPFQYDFPKNH